MLVARPDDLLEDTTAALTKQFPERTFKKVAVDLGTRSGAAAVEGAIKKLPCPQVCFLNAGYVQTGFFNQTPLEKQYANLDCNVGHVVALSHMLINRYAPFTLCSRCSCLRCLGSRMPTSPERWVAISGKGCRMLTEGKRGGFMFTSSAAAVMPSPFVSLYGSTKAFLSSFGASIAAEVRAADLPQPLRSRHAVPH